MRCVWVGVYGARSEGASMHACDSGRIRWKLDRASSFVMTPPAEIGGTRAVITRNMSEHLPRSESSRGVSGAAVDTKSTVYKKLQDVVGRNLPAHSSGISD